MSKILLYDEVSRNQSIVIIITRQGQDKNITKAMIGLKKAHIKTIVISANKNSLLSKRADYFIQASYIEGVRELGEIIYNISVQYILDILLSLIVTGNLEKAIAIYNENDKKFED